MSGAVNDRRRGSRCPTGDTASAFDFVIFALWERHTSEKCYKKHERHGRQDEAGKLSRGISHQDEAFLQFMPAPLALVLSEMSYAHLSGSGIAPDLPRAAIISLLRPDQLASCPTGP